MMFPPSIVAGRLYQGYENDLVDERVVKRPLNKIPQPSFFSRLPTEIILEIFRYLNAQEVLQMSRVCKQWKILSANPSLWDFKKHFPELNIIDAKVWERYVDLDAYSLSFKDPSNRDLRAGFLALKKLFSSPLVNQKEGITYMMIPEGLSLKIIKKIAGSPKDGYKTGFRHIYQPIEDQFGDIVVKKTFHVIITNTVLETSRNLSVDEQKKLLNQIGLKMPKLLPCAALAIMTYISSQGKTRLFNDNPLTYSRCSENIDGDDVFFGGFLSNGGLDIGIYDCEAISNGIAAMWSSDEACTN